MSDDEPAAEVERITEFVFDDPTALAKVAASFRAALRRRRARLAQESAVDPTDEAA